MKVWEKLKALKNAEAECEDIHGWFYMNRILPCMLDADILELKDLPHVLQEKITSLNCEDTKLNCEKCLNAFLDSEYIAEEDIYKEQEEKLQIPLIEEAVSDG